MATRSDLRELYGSTNTAIRRFLNVTENIGTAITYSDSATLGASFTINENGNYSISYNDQFAVTTAIGLSLNSTQLTTGVLSINVSDKVAISTIGTVNNPYFVGASLFLRAGDIIRPHIGAASAAAGSMPSAVQFIIAKVD